jgi:hypothetical protein
MSSTRNRARRGGVVLLVAMTGAVGLGVGAGCANGVEYEPQAETVQPMVVDEAMQTRDWEPVAVVYQNGDTIGGIDRAPIKPRFVTNSEYVQGGAAPFLFIGQALVTPITFLWAPPFEPVATQGEAFRPTYTGAPPVAADQPTPEEQAEQRRLRREQIRLDREMRFNDRDAVAPHGRNVFSDEPAPRPEGEPETTPAPEENAAPPAEAAPMEPVPPAQTPAAAPAETPPADGAPVRPAAPEEPVRGLGPGAPGQSVPNEAVPAQPAPAQPAPELNK